MKRHRHTSGHAVIETALMAPWIFLFFVAIVDFGFYAYAGISTSNAARVAALQTARGLSTAGSSNLACFYVLREMQTLPKVAGATSCSSTTVTATAVATQCTSANAAIGCPVADNSWVSTVTVTYQTLPLFPIPGMMGQLTITRVAAMRVGS
jgi:Flp pilus assembly protein TadG